MTLLYFSWATLYVVLLVLSVGLLVYLFFFAKKSPLLSSFIFFHIMTTLWSVYSIITLYADTFVTNRFMITFAADLVYGKPAVLLGGFTGFGWLMFSLNYVNKAIYKKFVGIFALPVLLLFASYLTNRYHHLFYGLYIHHYYLYWINLVISVAYTAAGFIILTGYATLQEKYEKTRTFLLLAAYMIPMLYIVFEKYVRDFIGISGNYPDYITLTPLTFFIANAFIIFIISRYRFLNITPMASNKIVENLSMAVIIVDSSHKVISTNKSLIENFSGGKTVRHNDTIAFLNDYIGKNMLDIPANYAILSAVNSITAEVFTGELIIDKPVRKYYEVTVQPVVEEKDILGRIITFDDNTRIKTAMAQLEENNEILSYLNNQLIEKNEQLKQYAATAEELAIVKERQRFSRDVHDTLGHTMTVLITQLKVAEILCCSNLDAARAKISETILMAKEGLNELRKSIMGIAPGRLADNNIEASLLRLINDFKSAGMKIDVTVNGLFDDLPEDKVQAIYRLCQEALTNSVRHGKATHVDIVMNSADDKLKVLIKDNGIGCKYIKKGFGLNGMEQRINSFGGNIHYGSDGENGFNIFVELPGREAEAG